MKKVVKFGGSSLASAKQFKKVSDIINADKARRFVVPSAPGKRDSKDEKVTDMLYQAYEAASTGGSYKKVFEKIKDRYQSIIDGLGLNLNLDMEFKKIEENFLAKQGKEYAASRGEYLNGMVLANYLGCDFLDAAEVIFFNEDGTFDAEYTNAEISARLENVKGKVVIPGFYGIDHSGKIRTFSRGGSDITGSIVARAIHADVYENLTDVSGFLIADPRIIKDPAVIETITYRELRELSYMGASVLHEDAIFPVRAEGIPINIRNTNRPEDKGTMIVESTCKRPRYTITGIAGKKGFCSINVDKAMMNAEVGFCRKVLEVFDENDISIEHMPSGIDTMSVFVHQDEFEDHEQRVVAGIHRKAKPDSVEMESGLALVAVVGRGMKANRGTAGRIFAALAHARINVKMIDQGSSEFNIIIGVRECDFESAIKAIYDIFVTVEL